MDILLALDTPKQLEKFLIETLNINAFLAARVKGKDLLSWDCAFWLASSQNANDYPNS